MNRKKAMTVMCIIIAVILICSFFLVRWIRNQNEETGLEIVSNETMDETTEDTTSKYVESTLTEPTEEESTREITSETSEETTVETTIETTEATVTVSPETESTPAQTKAPETTKEFAKSVTDEHGNVWIWDEETHSYLPGGGVPQNPNTTIEHDYVTSDDVDESVIGWE